MHPNRCTPTQPTLSRPPVDINRPNRSSRPNRPYMKSYRHEYGQYGKRSTQGPMPLLSPRPLQEPLVARTHHRSLGLNPQMTVKGPEATVPWRVVYACLIVLVVGLGVSTAVLAWLYADVLSTSLPPPSPPPPPYAPPPTSPLTQGRLLFEDTDQVFDSE